MFSTTKIEGLAAHGRRLDSYSRGGAHSHAKTDEVAVAKAKTMVRDAAYVRVIAPGEKDRIAAECRMSRRALEDIMKGLTWVHVEPAPATTTQET